MNKDLARLSPKARAYRLKQKAEYAKRPEVLARQRVNAHKWAIKNYGSLNRYQRHRSYLKRYGISIEEYERLHAKQKGRCRLCRLKKRKWQKHLAVDHDHATGKVRGLLCTFCNLVVARVDAERSYARRLEKYCASSL